MTRVHAFGDDALADLDAVGLVQAIQEGDLAVTDVVDAAIARVEKVDGALGAVAYADLDRARAEAREPRGGFFAGVPTFLKDNVDVAGMPTGSGSDSYEARPIRRDGDFARMYLATGLLPLGKTQLSEYGFSASAEHPRLGPVRSPWNTDHTAGASSAGSAALVAAGAVPIAHANDGGGSIRIPASVNGLVGLKPTRDRLAQDKLMRDMPIRIVSDGVVTRSVRDTAAFFRESEKVYRALHLPPVGDITRPGPDPAADRRPDTRGRRRRLAEVAELTLKTARMLEELGHGVDQVDPPMPDSLADDFLLYWSLLAFSIVPPGGASTAASGTRRTSTTSPRAWPGTPRRNLHRLPGRDRAAQAQPPPLRAAFTRVRRGPHPDPGPRDAADRPARPRPRTSTRSWAACSSWVAFTPVQNVTGEPADLPAARHHGRRPAAGDDVRRRPRPRGPAPRARLRARGGAPVRARIQD